LAKNLKINIKNSQIAQAINLGDIKDKLNKKQTSPKGKAKDSAATSTPKKPSKSSTAKAKPAAEAKAEILEEEAPRVRARKRSVFSEDASPEPKEAELSESTAETACEEIFKASIDDSEKVEATIPEIKESSNEEPVEPLAIPEAIQEEPSKPAVEKVTPPKEEPKVIAKPTRRLPTTPTVSSKQRFGPTGRHINDLLPPKKETPPEKSPSAKDAGKEKATTTTRTAESATDDRKSTKKKFKDFQDFKSTRKNEGSRYSRSSGMGGGKDDGSQYRRRRKGGNKQKPAVEIIPDRPKTLAIRLPISIKDLASEMKLKTSQLIGKLFMQGIVLTLNDFLDDETTIQLLGHEFECDITIDTSEEERIRITDKTILDEIKESDQSQLITRMPIVAFMGHVDHGKTSLIDAIRESNRAAGEAGAITQHIGAFRCETEVGNITVLDTPGHEAFSAMRARGADATDIVVLVVAGDEGMRQQTIEAIQHAKAAGVTIVVAINKCDKPNFDADTVYRQLADNELLPEAWGGETITINCSAVTKEGVKGLLEMLALQSEVLELRANPKMRARGMVLESEMHKGMGIVATILVQNGTLNHGDALVCGETPGRVKTMRNELNQDLKEAGASTPVEITGLSGLPEAGEEFIVVPNEKEAKIIAAARQEGNKQRKLQLAARGSLENLLLSAADSDKKILNVILRADVQGSLEALKTGLLKIESDKANVNVIFAGIGEISESDIQLAAASKAVVIGFHTQVESHAEPLIKQHNVTIRLHDIIYHAIDDAKDLMSGLLDKIAEEIERSKVLVKAVFKSSQVGRIAGSEVIEGNIHRNHMVRIMRDGEQVWKGALASLKREKDDVREVKNGFECGVVLKGFNDIQENDIIESYEIIYKTQTL
jgi:translation initiation factor IF-2